MKRLALFLGILFTASVITGVLMAKQAKPFPQRTYSVSLTNEQWISVLRGLESIKSAVKLSNMPANQSTFICDSLILVYQIEFDRQINIQKQSEEKAAQQKKDTITKHK